MKCTECGNEMQKGIVEVSDGHLVSFATVTWYPEDEKKKFFRKNAVVLTSKAEGYYCSECMKVVAIFEEK